MAIFNRKTPFALLLLCAFAANPVFAEDHAKQEAAHQDTTKITLLGTGGGPGGSRARAGIATLLTVNGQNYLFDAGDGVSRQLAKIGVPEKDITTIFFTHLHDDHTVGLPAVMSFFYTLRGKHMNIYGPPRTEHLIKGALDFLGDNAEIRMQEQHLPPLSKVFSFHNIGTGEVYKDKNITVTAIVNTHFHLGENTLASRNKSYSYKIVTPNKVIVMTGDTGPSKAVDELAKGADILISEMASDTDLKKIPPFIVKHVLTEHLSPAEVGKLAHGANAGILVLSHIRDVEPSDVAKIKEFYHGKVIVGKDLLQLDF